MNLLMNNFDLDHHNSRVVDILLQLYFQPPDECKSNGLL